MFPKRRRSTAPACCLLTTSKVTNILAKGRTTARAKAVASPAITDARARTLARATAAAPPTVPNHPRLHNQSTESEGRLVPALDIICHSFVIEESSMPANRFNGFTEYGIGIGLRIPHYRHILQNNPVVDWFEIISENYMIDGGRPLAVLDQILEQYRVVQHGVSMYFGSAEPLNREHLRRLKDLVRRTKTPWLSDHLCWGSVDGRYTHDLLPIPYTWEAVKLTAQKIRQVQDYLG